MPHPATALSAALESRRHAHLLRSDHARSARNRRTGGRGGMRRGGGGVPAFSPAAYGTMAVWRRGDDMTLNGATVSAWSDKSGNGRHLVQATAANQPSKSTGSLGGRDGISFLAASAKAMTGPNWATIGLTGAEIYIVAVAAADPSGAAGDGGGLWLLGSSAGQSYHPYSDGVVYDGAGSNAQHTIGNPTSSLTLPHVYSVSSIAGEYQGYIDGVAIGAPTANTVAWAALEYLGWNGVKFWSGAVYEQGIFTAKLSTPNRSALVAGLKAYYGGW